MRREFTRSGPTVPFRHGGDAAAASWFGRVEAGGPVACVVLGIAATVAWAGYLAISAFRLVRYLVG